MSNFYLPRPCSRNSFLEGRRSGATSKPVTAVCPLGLGFSLRIIPSASNSRRTRGKCQARGLKAAIEHQNQSVVCRISGLRGFGLGYGVWSMDKRYVPNNKNRRRPLGHYSNCLLHEFISGAQRCASCSTGTCVSHVRIFRGSGQSFDSLRQV